MDDGNIKAAVALKSLVPRNISDVSHVLGLLGYHMHHTQDFSSHAKPISDLLVKGHDEKKQDSKVLWSAECQLALESLIDNITSPPILAYPDFSKEFVLPTDASSSGLDCILYQKHEGKMCVVGCGSQTIHKAESNYHARKLES